MAAPRFDILGIGNAIVDQLAEVPESFLSRHDMRKGAMQLCDFETVRRLGESLPDPQETSGGSAANTCAVAASLGSRVAFLGKVAGDRLGARFREDITNAGVHFPDDSSAAGEPVSHPISHPISHPTGRCVVAVTPDGHRTLNTFLGAATGLAPEDIDPELIADSGVVYLEGYLFDPPAAQAAFHRAAQLAREAGRKVALSLSDPFCVDRHRAGFRAFAAGQVDLLFANEAEICSLYEEESFEAAAERARRDVVIAALTRSEAGSVVLAGERTIPIPAWPTRVVDTTGAGDAYAAGFLHAHMAGHDLELCGKLGSLAASEVIAHLGARPGAGLSARAAFLLR
ncbi:MAG TPA: adenosine kinase [Acetobacteraceae bacterium]|nr:adenosine kinase [Acetobacteraceae bacterium]